MTNKYKCDNHTMGFSCPNCTEAFFARYDELLDFVRELADSVVLPSFTLNDDPIKIINLINSKAQKVLKEIGELE